MAGPSRLTMIATISGCSISDQQTGGRRRCSVNCWRFSNARGNDHPDTLKTADNRDPTSSNIDMRRWKRCSRTSSFERRRGDAARANTATILGAALTQTDLPEAERLLLDGYQRLAEWKDHPVRHRERRASARVDHRFYQAWGKPERAGVERPRVRQLMRAALTHSRLRCCFRKRRRSAARVSRCVR